MKNSRIRLLTPTVAGELVNYSIKRLGLFLEEQGFTVGEAPCALLETDQGPDDCYIYYSMAFKRRRKGNAPGGTIPPALSYPLQSSHFLIQPVPLYARPEIIGVLKILRQSRILLHHWDPDYVSHLKLSDLAECADNCIEMPGITLSNIDSPSFDGKMATRPQLVYFANLKGDSSNLSRLLKVIKSDRKVGSLFDALKSDPDSDPLLLAAQAFQEEPAKIINSYGICCLLSELVQLVSNFDRIAIINAVKRFPSTIYTSLAPTGTNNKHPLCVIKKPTHYLDIYNSIQPGDIIPCHLPWRVKNAFSERCCTAMYRGAFPLVPNIGKHVHTFSELGLDDCLYDIRRPETLADAIGSLLDGTRNREQDSMRMHRYAMENFSERNYFHTVHEGINKLITAKCLSKIER